MRRQSPWRHPRRGPRRWGGGIPLAFGSRLTPRIALTHQRSLSRRCCEASFLVPCEVVEEAAAMARRLRNEQRSLFEQLNLSPLLPGNKSTPAGGPVPQSPACCVCGALKHRARWEYKRPGKVRHVTGGYCYACVRACCLLRTTRSFKALEDLRASAFRAAGVHGGEAKPGSRRHLLVHSLPSVRRLALRAGEKAAASMSHAFAGRMILNGLVTFCPKAVFNKVVFGLLAS